MTPSRDASEPGGVASAVPRPHLGQPHHHRRGGRHLLEGGPLARRVVLVSAGEDVRGGQAHLAQARAVGAAPDRPADRLDPLGPDRRLGRGRHLRHRAQEAAHVAVLLAHLDLEARPRLGGHDLLRRPLEQFAMALERLVVEVAQDEAHLRPPRVTGDLVGVDVALELLGGLGGQRVGRERGDNLRRQAQRIDQLPLGPPRMHLHAAHGQDHLERAERLVLELAQIRAVEGVGAARAEARDVEQRRALADLLVRSESDPERRPRQLGMGGEIGHCGHDLRHSRLVVGPEQGVAARRDDVMAGLAGQLGHPGRIEDGAVAWQREHAPVVVAVDDRLDAFARRIRAGVHVRDQADREPVATARIPARAGERRHHVAAVVEASILEAGLAQLSHQQAPELELPGRTRR
jgi:hypothetical protein